MKQPEHTCYICTTRSDPTHSWFSDPVCVCVLYTQKVPYWQSDVTWLLVEGCFVLIWCFSLLTNHHVIPFRSTCWFSHWLTNWDNLWKYSCHAFLNILVVAEQSSSSRFHMSLREDEKPEIPRRWILHCCSTKTCKYPGFFLLNVCLSVDVTVGKKILIWA